MWKQSRSADHLYKYWCHLIHELNFDLLNKDPYPAYSTYHVFAFLLLYNFRSHIIIIIFMKKSWWAIACHFYLHSSGKCISSESAHRKFFIIHVLGLMCNMHPVHSLWGMIYTEVKTWTNHTWEGKGRAGQIEVMLCSWHFLQVSTGLKKS